MLPFLIGGAVVLGVAALMTNDASSSNQRARDDYNDTYDKSVSKIKNNYHNAQQKDALDKLYKVKRAKVKIANVIYKELKGHRKNFNRINQDIKESKKTLDYLFTQKRATDDREIKILIQQDINIVQLSRKELFKIQDTLKEMIDINKHRLYIANEETQNIVKEIKNILDISNERIHNRV